MRYAADLAPDYILDYTYGTDVLPTLEAMLAPSGAAPASPVPIEQIPDEELELRRREISRWRRWATTRGYRGVKFRADVQTAYRQTCVVCGLRFPKSAHCLRPGVDAAHILPWRDYELDDVRNALCLCKLHHWAFDEGLLAIRWDDQKKRYRVEVTDTAARALAGEKASLDALRAHEGAIPPARLPANRAQWPRPQCLERLYEAVRPDLPPVTAKGKGA